MAAGEETIVDVQQYQGAQADTSSTSLRRIEKKKALRGDWFAVRAPKSTRHTGALLAFDYVLNIDRPYSVFEIAIVGADSELIDGAEVHLIKESKLEKLEDSFETSIPYEFFGVIVLSAFPGVTINKFSIRHALGDSSHTMEPKTLDEFDVVTHDYIGGKYLMATIATPTNLSAYRYDTNYYSRGERATSNKSSRLPRANRANTSTTSPAANRPTTLPAEANVELISGRERIDDDDLRAEKFRRGKKIVRGDLVKTNRDAIHSSLATVSSIAKSDIDVTETTLNTSQVQYSANFGLLPRAYRQKLCSMTIDEYTSLTAQKWRDTFAAYMTKNVAYSNSQMSTRSNDDEAVLTAAVPFPGPSINRTLAFWFDFTDSFETHYITVTIAGGVLKIDGTAVPVLAVNKGDAYVFDVSDSSLASHKFRFLDDASNPFTTGVIITGQSGQSGATVTLSVPKSGIQPDAYYLISGDSSIDGNQIVIETNNNTMAPSRTLLTTGLGDYDGLQLIVDRSDQLKVRIWTGPDLPDLTDSSRLTNLVEQDLYVYYLNEDNGKYETNNIQSRLPQPVGIPFNVFDPVGSFNHGQTSGCKWIVSDTFITQADLDVSNSATEHVPTGTGFYDYGNLGVYANNEKLVGMIPMYDHKQNCFQDVNCLGPHTFRHHDNNQTTLGEYTARTTEYPTHTRIQGHYAMRIVEIPVEGMLNLSITVRISAKYGSRIVGHLFFEGFDTGDYRTAHHHIMGKTGDHKTDHIPNGYGNPNDGANPENDKRPLTYWNTDTFVGMNLDKRNPINSGIYFPVEGAVYDGGPAGICWNDIFSTSTGGPAFAEKVSLNYQGGNTNYNPEDNEFGLTTQSYGEDIPDSDPHFELTIRFTQSDSDPDALYSEVDYDDGNGLQTYRRPLPLSVEGDSLTGLAKDGVTQRKYFYLMWRQLTTGFMYNRMASKDLWSQYNPKPYGFMFYPEAPDNTARAKTDWASDTGYRLHTKLQEIFSPTTVQLGGITEAGTPHHIAISRNAEGTSVYLDGELGATIAHEERYTNEFANHEVEFAPPSTFYDSFMSRFYSPLNARLGEVKIADEAWNQAKVLEMHGPGSIALNSKNNFGLETMWRPQFLRVRSSQGICNEQGFETPVTDMSDSQVVEWLRSVNDDQYPISLQRFLSGTTRCV